MPKFRYNVRHLLLSGATALAALFAACSDDLAGPDLSGGEAGFITIDLRASQISRATEPDSDALLNEDVISTAVVCLYPSDNPSGQPAFIQTFTDVGRAQGKVRISLNSAVRNRLFPAGATKCSAYVIANPPEGTVVTTAMTIESIRQLAVTADFASSAVQPSFAMDGSTADITISNPGGEDESAAGSVDLVRCASKITLAVNVADNVIVGEGEGQQVWTPQPSSMLALVSDGVQRSQFGSMSYTPVDGDYYSTSTSAADESHRGRGFTATTGRYPYLLQSPFYTFPNKWDSSLPDAHVTYMTLIVPWRLEGESQYRNCYYTVPVLRGSEIGRNISYRVNLNINMLGSFTPDEPLELTDLSYTAVPWGEVTTDVDIADSRYLVVDQNTFSINNESGINIPVYTSHPTEVKEVTLTYFRYYTTAQGFEKAITITPAQYEASPAASDGSKIYTYSFHNSTEAEPYSSVSFDHPLVVWNPYNGNTAVSIQNLSDTTTVNDRIKTITNYRISNPEEAAYSRYVAKITIVHSDKIGQPDESAYTQVLTVTQYPQMYITSTANYYNANGATGEEGNTFVNGNQEAVNEGWYRVRGLYAAGSGTNANPNQYVIHVTQLNLGEDYIIGDPRVSEHTDLYGWKTWTTGWRPVTTHYFGESGAQAPNNNWTEAKDMSGVTRRLTYYYPADESTTKARWIAPAFRVASSYGVCSNENNYAKDKARCAGYQEMSRPAGRWRMPTVAEIEYIMKLSQKGKIPVLFNTGGDYMSAQGPVSTTFNNNGQLNTPNSTNGTCAVRCVYDEWYWGNDTITPDSDGKYVFTWGDRPRSAPQ